VVDHLRTSTQWQETTRARPVSWHPDYLGVSGGHSYPASNEGDLNCWGYATAQVNGLVTPMSYPVVSEPQIQELFTPLDELPVQEPGFSYAQEPGMSQQLWLHQNLDKMESYAFAPYPQQPMQSQWYYNPTMVMNNVPTTPLSPECPPLHTLELNSGSPGASIMKPKDDSEELVGLGLYDSPAEIQSSSLLFGGASRLQGDGLKLGESFEPTEQPDDDEEDDGRGDEEAEQDEEPRASALQEGETTYDLQPRPEPLASQYLATLRQMNSSYYPSSHLGSDQGYGWI
jgi:hypothetical protein